MAKRNFSAFCAIAVLVWPGAAFAEVPPHCRQAERSYEDFLERAEDRELIDQTTEAALAEVTTEWLESRVDDPVSARNEILDRIPPVRTRNQRLIVRRMLVVYCEIIFSRATPDDDAKLDQLNRLTAQVSSAEPFRPVARTGREQQARWQRSLQPREPAFQVSATWYENDTDTHFVRVGSPQREGTTSSSESASDVSRFDDDDWFDEFESEFLAGAPYVVNDTNKYFVIVGSAASKSAGVKMMNKFKMASPEHDFALYPPYRGNLNYGVMIASWVSRDVAMKAQAEGLEVAKKALKDDFKEKRDTPFIWCYPTGPCKSDAAGNSNDNRKKRATKKSEMT